MQALPLLSSYAVTEAYFSICLKYLTLFDALNRNGLLALALLQFDAYLPELNELFLSNPAYRGKSDYELFYQAGGFWNVTVRRLNHGAKESPADMARVISSIMPPTLRTEA